MLAEPFAHGQSFVHGLDPRVRIAISTVFSCLVAVAHSFTVLSIACVIALGLVLLARLDLAAVGRRVVGGLRVFDLALAHSTANL